MSISPSRVVGRILLQALEWPAEASQSHLYRAEEFRRSTEAPLLELSWAARADFPTLLHFWAHGLRRFLSRQGAEHQFLGAGSYSICEQVPGVELAAALERYRASLRDPSAWCAPQVEWQAGYRMIESACRVSYAGESEDHFLAFFWCHGSIEADSDRESLPVRPVAVLPH